MIKSVESVRPYDDLVINGNLETCTVVLRALESGTGDYKRGALLDIATDGTYVLHGGEATTAEEKFNGDGSTKEFTVTGTASGLPEAVTVTVGGEEAEDAVYNSSTGKITFTTAPVAGTNNVVATYATEALTADVILAEDITLADENAVTLAYRKGTFSQTIVEKRSAESNGDVAVTISAADERALRLGGIYLVDSFEL